MTRTNGPTALGDGDIIQAGQLESWVGCVGHLRAQLGAAGLLDVLPAYQIEILRDIENGFDEYALARMHRWWAYDWPELLAQEGSRKPRIFVWVGYTTQRNNFSVLWQPVSSERDRSWWQYRKNDFERPGNELLFVRSLKLAAQSYSALRNGLNDRSKYGIWYERTGQAIDAYLLVTVARMMSALKERLEYTFEVCMVSDIYMEWTSSIAATNRQPEQTLSWEIEDVEAWRQRQERQELKDYPSRTGCTSEALANAMQIAASKKRTGPAPKNGAPDDRIARELGKMGIKMSPPEVRRYRELLREYDPKSLPDWDRPPLQESPPSTRRFLTVRGASVGRKGRDEND